MFKNDVKMRTITVIVCLLAVMLTATAVENSAAALSRQGSTGAQVRQIQQRLIALGYLPQGGADGVYGAQTESAVRRFQQARGISADGVAGVVTLTALDITFRQGSSGEDVTSIQQRLKNLGYLSGAADGVYGAQTASAVREFQTQNNLTSDGVVGFATAKQLYSASAKRKASSAGSHSNSDQSLLARIISAEARGEPYAGQVAVGAVVLNRVEHPSFPDTVAGVVYQPGAFDAVYDGQVNMAPAESSQRAAREALNGSDPSGGAIYYYNPATATNQWIRSRQIIATIGKHVFCK
jgi:N-acetylmuramoyl-L-alanine amidase